MFKLEAMEPISKEDMNRVMQKMVHSTHSTLTHSV